MSASSKDAPIPICITCGLPTGVPAQLNRLTNGKLCPTCRDRVLDEIPAPFPSSTREKHGALERDAEIVGREGHFDGEHRPWPPHGLGN